VRGGAATVPPVRRARRRTGGSASFSGLHGPRMDFGHPAIDAIDAIDAIRRHPTPSTGYDK
jgi:hypothetical protein